MEMFIHLDSDIFDVVKKGSKHIEVRVYDEKRRKLNVGDSLVFLERPDEVNKIYATVKDLKVYSNFNELVKYYDIKDMYLDGITKDDFLKLLERFYSIEEQNQYGVVAIDFEVKEKSCGAVVFNDNNEVLMVRHNNGHWGFPKGHVEGNETEEETAIREVKEETNVDVSIDTNFRRCITYSPRANTVKDVIFFSGKANDYELVKQDSEISDVRFVSYAEAFSLMTYDNDKDVLNKAFEYMKKRG